MPTPLILHELTLSPNNVKARIALGYKGLEYERRPAAFTEYPGDRTPIVELSRQPRLPVLEHGKTIVFDSGAIVRYLEANFPDTPPLFSTDYAKSGELEQWELWARTELGQPIRTSFGQVFAPQKDAATMAQASAQMNQLTARIEERLGKSPFLFGDEPTIADITCVPLVNLAMLSKRIGDAHPISGFFRDNLHLGEGRERTRRWVAELIGYDPAFAG